MRWKYMSLPYNLKTGKLFKPYAGASGWIPLDCYTAEGSEGWELLQVVEREGEEFPYAILKRAVVTSEPRGDLVPCPFCGAGFERLTVSSEPLGLHGQAKVFFVRCASCATRGPWAAEAPGTAMERWNERREASE